MKSVERLTTLTFVATFLIDKCLLMGMPVNMILSTYIHDSMLK